MAEDLTTMEEANFSFQAKSQSRNLTNPGRPAINQDQAIRRFNPE
jgi:hypothetical protein